MSESIPLHIQEGLYIAGFSNSYVDTLYRLLSDFYPVKLVEFIQDQPIDESSITSENSIVFLHLDNKFIGIRDLLSAIRKMNPSCKIIAMHHYIEEEYAKQIIQSGATYYLPTNSPVTDFFTVLQCATANHPFTSALLQ